MLYILYMRNHPDITYRGGQGPLIHLMADLRAVVAWAEENDVMWAFSDTNAGARYAQIFSDLDSLDKVHWEAVRATDFRDSAIKEGKQAEFLVHKSLPLDLVVQVGIKDNSIKAEVEGILENTIFKPLVTVESSWYY